MTWPTNPSSRTKFTTGQRKLGEVCEIISPGIKKFEGIKKYVATADVDFDKIVNFSEITYSNRPSRANMETKENDALVARMAETKKFLVVSKELQNNYIFSTGFAVLRTKKDLLPKCLFYFLTTKDFNLQKNKLAVGATQKAINNPALKRIKIPILPLPIQQKIVERLDAIKKAQELNDKQIELTEELFQSLLHRELDPKGKNWDFVKLGNVVQKIEYGLSVSVQNRLDENGVPILTMAEIENDGQINYQKTRKISASANELKKFKINKGELLFNWRNEKALIGKTGLFESEKDFIFASFLLRIVTNEKILPEFLWYWLNYLRTKNAYLQYAHLAGNQASYNANSLQNKISCPLILIKNQQKIVEKLSAVQEYKKKLLEQKQKLNELFESVLNKSMKRELIK